MKGTNAVRAKRNTKTVTVCVTFFTNGLAAKAKTTRSKHAWDGGFVRVNANRHHKLVSSKNHAFHSFDELASAVADALVDSGVILHRSRRSKKLYFN